MQFEAVGKRSIGDDGFQCLTEEKQFIGVHNNGYPTITSNLKSGAAS